MAESTQKYIDGLVDHTLQLEANIVELHKKLEAVKHHFEHHECMYVFDFNLLMEENSSELCAKNEVSSL